MDERTIQYIFDNAPALILILDGNNRIVESNTYANKILGHIRAVDFHDLILDFNGKFSLPVKGDRETIMLHTICQNGTPRTFLYQFKTQENQTIVIGREDFEEIDSIKNEMVRINQDLSNTSRELTKKNFELQDALDHIKTLQGIIPICMHCKKLRNDEDVWKSIEEYLDTHSNARLSHGICPECMKKYYGEDSDFG